MPFASSNFELDAGNSDPRRISAMREAVASFDTQPSPPSRLRELREWIVAGYYGRCSVCGGEIATARLESDPTRRVCAACEVPDHAAGRLR